jgi:ComF family protein
LPLPGSPAGSICITCSADPLPVAWSEAWGEYRDALEAVLHAFKFDRHDFLDDPLAALMEECWRTRGDAAFDAVVPVPMFRSKQRRRGYNQAELLGRALARRIGVRFEPSLLAKNEERQTQSTLARAQRAANVRGVFAASGEAKGRSVLIVDDVSTTGETFRACAGALLQRGASRVAAMAVAKAT